MMFFFIEANYERFNYSNLSNHIKIALIIQRCQYIKLESIILS